MINVSNSVTLKMEEWIFPFENVLANRHFESGDSLGSGHGSYE